MYRYILEPYKNRSSRHRCPECGHANQFAYYIDTETGEPLPEHVGRCNRENSCGYHYTAKQYFNSTQNSYIPSISSQKEIVEQAVDYMPLEYVEGSLNNYEKTNFAWFLNSLFGNEITQTALLRYFAGRSTKGNGTACIFWRIDNQYRVRTGKIIYYDALTGKRIKEINPTWVHSNLQPFNYKLCFFGEHLLSENKHKTVGIVESEKTAVIASIYMPELIWLATGGNSGCKWRDYSVYNVLKNRNIILFPDFGYFNKKTLRTCYDEWKERANGIQERMSCSMTVSRLLEDNIPEEQRENDFDLADMLIKRKDGHGLALTDEGYPVMWDLIGRPEEQLK